METVQLTISDAVQAYLQRQAVRSGHSSPQDYLQSLLDELEIRVQEKQDLEASLLEAIRSPRVLGDEAFWAERRRKLAEREDEMKRCSSSTQPEP